MKIEFERAWPYDNPFARGVEYRVRILRGPIWYFRNQWTGPSHRPWRRFIGDYLNWLRKY